MRYIGVFAGIGLLLAVTGTAGATTLTVGPGKTYAHIQNAVDYAASHPLVDVIEVYAGTYLRTVASSGESVVKVKTGNLTIMGVGDGDKVIDVAPYGAGGNNTGIAVLANDVTISGFTVTFNNPDGGVGIALVSSYGSSLPDPSDDVANNCTITGNVVSGFGRGIQYGGSDYYPSSGNSISGNTLYGNGYGIEVSGAGIIDDTLIDGNTAYDNIGGIAIVRDGFAGDIKNVTVQGNTLYDNTGYAILFHDLITGFGDLDNIAITGNDMMNNEMGVFVYNTVADASGVSVHCNNIVHDTAGKWGVYNWATTGTVDATGNWWGDDGGPGVGGATKVGGDVDWYPHWVGGPKPAGGLIPEPVTMAGLMLGIGCLARYVRKRR